MHCEDCGKKSAVTRSTATGNIYRCLDCDSKAEERYGVKRDVVFGIGEVKKEFKEYTMEDGHLWSLPDGWPGFDRKTKTVRITSPKHERETLERLGCHYVERGETISGHKAALRGFTPRVYSFLGNRKASTCR